MKVGFIVFSIAILLGDYGAAMATAHVDKKAAPAAVGDIHSAGESADCVAVVPWPGDSTGFLVSVTMQNAGMLGFEKQLGLLTVDMFSHRDQNCFLVASNIGYDQPRFIRAITPSVPSARVDPAVFRMSPSEIALAVDVGEEITTSSVLAGNEYLILYRRVGLKLTPIFRATTDEDVLDKTGSRSGWHRIRHIVRFTSHLSHGFYDLVLAQPHQRGGQTFVWTGTYYAGRRS